MSDSDRLYKRIMYGQLRDRDPEKHRIRMRRKRLLNTHRGRIDDAIQDTREKLFILEDIRDNG